MYDGAQTTAALQYYFRKIAGPPLRVFSTLSDVASFIEEARASKGSSTFALAIGIFPCSEILQAWSPAMRPEDAELDDEETEDFFQAVWGLHAKVTALLGRFYFTRTVRRSCIDCC